jgi:hypothetical protein
MRSPRFSRGGKVELSFLPRLPVVGARLLSDAIATHVFILILIVVLHILCVCLGALPIVILGQRASGGRGGATNVGAQTCPSALSRLSTHQRRCAANHVAVLCRNPRWQVLPKNLCRSQRAGAVCRRRTCPGTR